MFSLPTIAKPNKIKTVCECKWQQWNNFDVGENTNIGVIFLEQNTLCSYPKLAAMKFCYFFLLFTLLLFSNCRKSKEAIPDCVQSKITDFHSTPCEYGGSVDEYLFQEQVVFVFYMGSCYHDQVSEVVDKNCNRIGLLGGYTGNTIINGEEFSNANYVRNLWSR